MAKSVKKKKDPAKNKKENGEVEKGTSHIIVE
jgi:hypothetical protein